MLFSACSLIRACLLIRDSRVCSIYALNLEWKTFAYFQNDFLCKNVSLEQLLFTLFFNTYTYIQPCKKISLKRPKTQISLYSPDFGLRAKMYMVEFCNQTQNHLTNVHVVIWPNLQNNSVQLNQILFDF